MQVTLSPTKRKTLVGRLREVSFDDVANADIERFREVWKECGGPTSPSARLLTAPNANAKTDKSKRPEYILHLAPERTAEVGNVCHHSTRGCRKVCLFYSGRASVWSKINAGRIAKTRAAFEYPAGFLAQLSSELIGLANQKIGSGLRPFVRLNGTSDLDWTEFAGVSLVIASENKRGRFQNGPIKRGGFYIADYTKAPPVVRRSSSAYPLARSVWIDYPQAVKTASEYLRNGEKVSLVIADTHLLEAFTDTYAKPGVLADTSSWERMRQTHFDYVKPGVIVDASKTDEWLLDDRARLGLLTPKHPATAADGFTAEAVRSIIREGGLI